MASAKRARKEKALKAAMAGCLHDRGHEPASWEKAPKAKSPPEGEERNALTKDKLLRSGTHSSDDVPIPRESAPSAGSRKAEPIGRLVLLRNTRSRASLPSGLGFGIGFFARRSQVPT
jgi:hypothetical protein